MEHIPQNSLTEFINEVKRVLKVGGVFIARVPNGDSPFGLLNQNGDVTHITTIGSGKAHYFAKKCAMQVVFLGGEAQPVSGNTLLGVTHRIISLPIKKLLHIVTNLIFFPRSTISFYSSNLTLIFTKPN